MEIPEEEKEKKYKPLTSVSHGVTLVWENGDDEIYDWNDESITDTEEGKRVWEQHVRDYPAFDTKKTLAAHGYTEPLEPVFGPDPRPLTIAQVRRQTYCKRTPKNFCFTGLYEIDESDPIPRLKSTLSHYPKYYDFGFTKDSYFKIPNPQAILPGPASGTRSQVKRRRSLCKNLDSDEAAAAAADAHTSRRN